MSKGAREGSKIMLVREFARAENGPHGSVHRTIMCNSQSLKQKLSIDITFVRVELNEIFSCSERVQTFKPSSVMSVALAC